MKDIIEGFVRYQPLSVYISHHKNGSGQHAFLQSAKQVRALRGKTCIYTEQVEYKYTCAFTPKL